MVLVGKKALKSILSQQHLRTRRLPRVGAVRGKFRVQEHEANADDDGHVHERPGTQLQLSELSTDRQPHPVLHWNRCLPLAVKVCVMAGPTGVPQAPFTMTASAASAPESSAPCTGIHFSKRYPGMDLQQLVGGLCRCESR